MSNDEVEQLTIAQQHALVSNGNLFCWRTFITGFVKNIMKFLFDTIFSPEFMVWAVFTFLYFNFYAVKGDKDTLYVYAVISIIFIIARSIRHVLEHKTTVEVKLAAETKATAALTGDLSQMAKTAINEFKGGNQ